MPRSDLQKAQAELFSFRWRLRPLGTVENFPMSFRTKRLIARINETNLALRASLQRDYEIERYRILKRREQEKNK